MQWIRQNHLKTFAVIQGLIVVGLLFFYSEMNRFSNISHFITNASWFDRFTYSVYLLEQLIWLDWLLLLSCIGIWMHQKWGWWIASFIYLKYVFFSIYVLIYSLITAPMQMVLLGNMLELFVLGVYSALILIYLYSEPVMGKFSFNSRSHQFEKLRFLAITASLPVFVVLVSHLFSFLYN